MGDEAEIGTPINRMDGCVHILKSIWFRNFFRSILIPVHFSGVRFLSRFSGSKVLGLVKFDS